MESLHTDPDLFTDETDPYYSLPPEFALQLQSQDDFSQWLEFVPAIHAPGPSTFTNHDLQLAERSFFPVRRDRPFREDVPCLQSMNVNSQQSSNQTIGYQSQTTGLLDNIPANEEVILTKEEAHGSSFVSYSPSVWNTQKERIKHIYMDEFKSLEETMKYMAENHDFRPSKKMYKDKFKEWGWLKNLPNAMASWMFKKWDQRMKELDKDTTFEMGGRIWTSKQVLKRIKRTDGQQVEDISEDATTPFGVTYSTPYTIASRNATPALARAASSTPDIVLTRVVSRATDRWTPLPTSQTPQSHQLATRWKQYTRTDIEKLRRDAEELAFRGETVEADAKLREALVGLENLLPPTHEDINAVAYRLAAFYAQHNRMREADGVLSRLGEQHLERWGMNHQKTRAHIHQVAELYHSWNRQSDAIAFLCRAFSYYDRLFDSPERGETISSTAGSSPLIVQTSFIQPPRIRSVEPATESANSMEVEEPSTEVAIKVEEADGPSLLSLMEQCEKYPEHLGEEILQAHRTLINCCRTTKNKDMLSVALERSETTFWKIFDSDQRKTKLILDAAVELAKAHLLAGNDEVAGDMFLRIELDTVESLGPDDFGTIAILIDIGKIYQHLQRWPDACPRFEHALAASLTAYGLESKFTRQLEAALENERYEVSYLNTTAYEESSRRDGFSFRPNAAFPML